MSEKNNDENNVNGEHSRIGNYQLQEVIGKRGKSIVYIAMQESPVRRKVVLRLIETGMDRNDVMASFKSIKQASANLSHTHIARFFDAGITDMGYAYFVTEYVPGLSITEYCDKYKLSIPDRLELFNDICRVIREAHFKGIVHLGLRPSSIRVTFQNGRPVIKIVDFGIAKVLADQDLIETALHTGHEDDAPLYMSPEQAALSEGDIDTRSDVYSLGALLYELLTGVTPYDKDELEGANFVEISRKIREDVPMRLSDRVDSLPEEEKSDIAKKRRITGQEIKKELQGDLDAIVMKALEKERKNRYDSVSIMMTDIIRYLKHEPVLAHQASLLYNARKFLMKNRIAAAAAGVVLLLVVILFLLNVTGRISAESARREAEKKRENSDYYYAAALKEKAAAYAKQNRWQMVRLFSVNSLLFQAKAKRYFPMGDIPLPFQFQCWVQKYSLPGYSPLVGVSSDSRFIASGDKEGIIKIWEVSSGKEVTTLKGTLEFIRAVSFDPNGNYLAAAGKEAVKIWDISGQKEIASLLPTSDKQTIISVRYSPDGKYLVACGTKEITIWEADTGTVTAALKENAGHLNRVGFSPDSRSLVSWDDAGMIKLYELANPGAFRVLKGEGEPVYSVCFSPDGAYAAAGGDQGVDIWDTANREVVTRLTGDNGAVSSVCFSPGGQYTAFGSLTGIIKIFETRIPAGEATTVLEIGDTPVLALGFSPDGNYLISAGGDKIIRVWETYSKKRMPSLQGNDGYGRSICFGSDGRYIAAGGNSTLRIWETAGGNQLVTLTGFTNPAKVVTFSPDGKHVAAGWGRTARLWDIAGGAEAVTLKGELKGLNCIDFNPDGRYLAGSGERAIKIWEAATGSEVAVFQSDIKGTGPVSFSPNGRYLASGDSQGRIKIRDLSTLELEDTLTGHDGAITSICFSPDGKHLLSGALKDKAVKIWDIDDGGAVVDLAGHEHEIYAVTYSPDGKYAVSAGKTGAIKIWDISRNEEVATLRGSGFRPAGLDFSPDGEFLAAAYGDNIKIWDFPYFLRYLNFDLTYPYDREDVEKLVKKVEKETGFVLAGMQPRTPENAYSYYNRGEMYLENREYHKAAAAYKESIDLNPGFVRAWYELGAALRHTKEYEESAATLQKAIELNPRFHKAWFELGIVYRQKGEYDNAVSALQKAGKIKPAWARNRYELGRAYVQKKEYTRAIENFNRAVEMMPDFQAAWFRMGQTYDQTGDYDKAVSAFEKALELSPGDEAAWNNLGLTLNKMNHYDRSIQCFEKAVEIDPDYAAAWNNMGITYRGKGDFQGAIANHNRAIEVNPAYDLAWEALGNTYNLKKEYTKAVAAYKRGIKINPRSWSAYANIGFIYIIKEEYAKAIDAFEMTAEINPGFFDAWNSLGDLYAREGEYKSSVNAYRKAVRIRPDDNEVRNNLGKSYYLKGDYGDALEQFRKATGINSRDHSAHFHIALTYLAQKKFEEAFDYYLKVMEQLKPDKDYIASAIKDIDKLIGKNPDYNFAYLVRRYLYNKAGDKAKAREDLERFIGFIKSSKKEE